MSTAKDFEFTPTALWVCGLKDDPNILVLGYGVPVHRIEFVGETPVGEAMIAGYCGA